MREIAVSAGVSPGAAYRHFSSQEELFLNVVEHVFGHLESALTATLDLSQGVEVGLRRIAHAYVQWGLEHPGGYQLLFETTDDVKLLAAGQRPGLHLIDQIGDYWESGLFASQYYKSLCCSCSGRIDTTGVIITVILLPRAGHRLSRDLQPQLHNSQFCPHNSAENPYSYLRSIP
jgi:Tetracyclin repressor-like, C-terminal domain/Bacterial regulatory proteins, tetR family